MAVHRQSIEDEKDRAAETELIGLMNTERRINGSDLFSVRAFAF